MAFGNQQGYMTYNPYRAGIAAIAPPWLFNQGQSKVPTRGGMSYARSLTRYKRKPNRYNGKKSFRRKVLDTITAKHLTWASGTNLVQGSTQCLMPTRDIIRGIADYHRIGDSVELEALKLKGTIRTATDSKGYVMRMIVLFSGEENSTLSTSWAFTGLGTAELFLPNTDALNATNGIVNKKAATVLFDQTYELNSQVASARTLHNIEATIPLKTHFPYQADGSTFGKYKNLYVFVVAYANDTPPTTIIGALDLSGDLIFKDNK